MLFSSGYIGFWVDKTWKLYISSRAFRWYTHMPKKSIGARKYIGRKKQLIFRELRSDQETYNFLDFHDKRGRITLLTCPTRDVGCFLDLSNTRGQTTFWTCPTRDVRCFMNLSNKRCRILSKLVWWEMSDALWTCPARDIKYFLNLSDKRRRKLSELLWRERSDSFWTYLTREDGLVNFIIL